MARIIYSLLLDLGEDEMGQLLELIAPLNAEGHSDFISPVGKRRAIDLRVGDQVVHDGRCHRVKNIRAYRENTIEAGSWTAAFSGYVVGWQSG